MQNISQIFTSEKFEEQFQNYVNKFRFEFQAKQRMLLTPLLIFYIVVKIQERNWFAMGLNVILLIAILFTLKFEGAFLKAYNILFVLALLLFNLFYAVSFYMQVNPERYQYIDGYFVAILTLGIIKQLQTIQKTMILLLLYIFLIVMMFNPAESLWSQIVKFLSYIFLYCQSEYYQEKLLRSTYVEYRKHLKIEKNLLKNQDIKCFVTYFNKQKQSIMIENQQVQDQFSEFTRKINIICKKSNSHSLAVHTQSDKMNLEQFLFYYFTDPKKTQVISPHCDEKNPYLHGISKSEHYQIRIVKCYDSQPKAILLVTEHQKELSQQKLKLQKKLMFQLLNYFEDIFLKQIRVSLIALKGANQNFEEIRKKKLKQLINFLLGKLYIAQNSFYNISDFLFPNADYNKKSIIQVDLMKIVQEALSYVKYNNSWNSKVKVKFDENIILSDQKLIKQLFINLIQFSATYSHELEISITDDQDLSFSPQQIVNVKFLLTCAEDSNIFLKHHPIINPQTIEELKKNCSNELELHLPISLLIIRNLGPFDKITFRSINRNQYKLQFYLYKHLDFKSKLIPIMSFDPKYYITKKENWQLTEFQQRQTSTGIYGSSPRLRLDTCRASNTMKEQFFTE